MKLILISDTHWWYPEKVIPDGDVLVHAGDISSRGRLEEITRFNLWFSRLPHKHKILIAGNHDWGFEYNTSLACSCLDKNITYLQDSGVEIEGVKFWGSPWTPEFCNWAFNLPRSGERLEYYWNRIPNNTDVLITHGPPHGILDLVERGGHVGCELLRKRVMEVKPKLHVFGHIHCGYGETDLDGVHFVNASMCTEEYKATNPPVVFDLK